MSLLVTADQLLARRAEIARSADLRAVDEHLAADVARVLVHPLYVPEAKALLSRWGSLCRDDEAELAFDPFSPQAQRCTKCGRIWDGEQAHRWWVYWYQLWLAERVLMMALRSGPGGDAAAETRALETLSLVAERYLQWPNADNVLGPSRPFFSTYLESIWVLHLAAAASLLEDLGRLPRQLGAELKQKLFAPSAAIIADFDEGRSNRQVWNAAALFALGCVLGDEAMRAKAQGGGPGIIGTLANGLLEDGLWYEGENYHWFALRGLAWGAELLRQSGKVDLWSDTGEMGYRFRHAFSAPVLTALPDFTFPARRDSKFGVSLRQRRMAELWERTLTSSVERGTGNGEGLYASLLHHVYDPAVPEAPDESWREITDVERAEPPRGLRRSQLGWKGWLWMRPELPAAEPAAWRPGTVHLEATGLAIFRRDEGATYVSLDYGEPGGGHGHPDRLNLTAVLRGVPWLLDFGTGSYVAPSLAWYRATLAHNAPLVDGNGQHTARGTCVAFDERDGFGWACAMLPPDTAFAGAAIQRTIVVAPDYLLDVVQLMSDSESRRLQLPWHGLGALKADEHGLLFTRQDAELRVHLAARQPFQVLVQRGAGPPPMTGGEAPDLDYAVTIGAGEAVTLVACLDPAGLVSDIECVEDDFVVHLADGAVHTHRATEAGWQVERTPGEPVELEGLVEPGEAPVDQPDEGAPPPTHPLEEPLVLDRADQFRRAELPWEGKDKFSARARLDLHDDGLRVAVDVTASSPRFRSGDEADPQWENENPDIHSDGIQVYVEDGGLFGWLIVPDEKHEGALRVAPVQGTDAEKAMITNGTWEPTSSGYLLTFDIMLPQVPETDFGFDLYVNRLGPDRERRSGQLVWSGARGHRLYLAGDRSLSGPLPRVGL